ncbi:MAG: outer membrane beta-barrel protein, partial [Oceanicaulis sp.]
MKTILLSTAAALIAATAASAQETAGNVHLGAGYTLLDTDGVEFDAINLRGGYDFTPFVGVEGEALIGLGEEDLGLGVDASFNYGLGAYVKGQYPVTEALSVFGRAGYVFAEVEASAAGVS